MEKRKKTALWSSLGVAVGLAAWKDASVTGYRRQGGRECLSVRVREGGAPRTALYGASTSTLTPAPAAAKTYREGEVRVNV